jgi:hypothetical protein
VGVCEFEASLRLCLNNKKNISLSPPSCYTITLGFIFVGSYSNCPFLAYFASHMPSRFIYVVVYVRISFLYKAEQYCSVCIHHILLIYSSISGYLGCFHIWTAVNNAAMNTDLNQCSKSLLSILLHVYREEELLVK